MFFADVSNVVFDATLTCNIDLNIELDISKGTVAISHLLFLPADLQDQPAGARPVRALALTVPPLFLF